MDNQSCLLTLQKILIYHHSKMKNIFLVSLLVAVAIAERPLFPKHDRISALQPKFGKPRQEGHNWGRFMIMNVFSFSY